MAATYSGKHYAGTDESIVFPIRQHQVTLDDIHNLLHISVFSETIRCRERECKTLQQFALSAVSKEAKSGALYISGCPGTGKTFATKLIVEQTVKTQPSSYIYVNAMNLLDPNQVFSVIYQKFTNSNTSISSEKARCRLNAIFGDVDSNRLPILLIVDELDMLMTPRQQIVYDIFNWVTNEKARVSVIAIANTLDLPERMLCQRITSRLGANRIIFQPYTYDQIEEIIYHRLNGCSDLLNHDAIQSAARRVASVSGDLRKAFEIVRHSIRIAICHKSKRLTIEHVNEAYRDVSTTVRVRMIIALPQHSLLLFRAVVAQMQHSGMENNSFIDVYKQYRLMCNILEGIAPYQEYGCYSMVMRMCSNNLLVAGPGTNCMRRLIRLGMTVHDALSAIKSAMNHAKTIPPFCYDDDDVITQPTKDLHLLEAVDVITTEANDQSVICATFQSSIGEGYLIEEIVGDSSDVADQLLEEKITQPTKDLHLLEAVDVITTEANDQSVICATFQSSIGEGYLIEEIVGDSSDVADQLLEEKITQPTKDLHLLEAVDVITTEANDESVICATFQSSIGEGYLIEEIVGDSSDVADQLLEEKITQPTKDLNMLEGEGDVIYEEDLVVVDDLCRLSISDVPVIELANGTHNITYEDPTIAKPMLTMTKWRRTLLQIDVIIAHYRDSRLGDEEFPVAEFRHNNECQSELIYHALGRSFDFLSEDDLVPLTSDSELFGTQLVNQAMPYAEVQCIINSFPGADHRPDVGITQPGTNEETQQSSIDSTVRSATVILPAWQRTLLEIDHVIDEYRDNNINIKWEVMHDRESNVGQLLFFGALERFYEFLFEEGDHSINSQP